MNGLLLVLFGGLAVAVIFAYLGGRQAGLGRGEQDRGDLAEENTALRKYVGGLEERVTAQYHRIVAMTAWETVPWPSGVTSPAPERPGPERLPAEIPVLYDQRRPRDAREDPDLIGTIPRQRRPRRTSTAAFLSPNTLSPSRTIESPGDGTLVRTPAWAEWPSIEDEIWSAKLWLATL